MILGFLEIKTIYTILHLIGVALGAGGAYISGFLFLSGAVTFASWTFALALGSIKSIPYSYLSILSVYFVFLLLSILGVFVLRKLLCPPPKQ